MNPEYLKTTDVTKIQYRNSTNYMPLEKLYCGPKVALTLEGNNLSEEEKKLFRLRYMDFYITSAPQISKRFTFNSSVNVNVSIEMSILKQLSFLNPDKVQLRHWHIYL